MILVTGATGFIGSHLVEELLEKEKKIKVLLKDKNNIGGLKEIPDDKLKKIVFEEGDLLDKDSLIKATKNVEKVFHLAAIARPMNVKKEDYFNVNVTGTKNLLEVCKQNKIKKIIHVSSMSVFGFSRDGKPLKENSMKAPVSDYGESKKQGEELVILFCKKNKINFVIVRPPMVFGPRDRQFQKLFVLINTGLFPLLKEGRARFEFCYVKNLVYGIILADKNGKNGEDYNISDGKTYTIKEVFELIAKEEGKRFFPFSIPVFIPRIAGKLCEIISKTIRIHPPFNSGTALWMSNDNVMDISRAKKELGYKNLISIKEGVKETVDWYRRQGVLNG